MFYWKIQLSCYNFVIETANNLKNLGGKKNLRTMIANNFFLILLSFI